MRSNVKRGLLWTLAGTTALLTARAIIRAGRAIPLRGRTVMITGGSRGLGLVLAREFAKNGAQIAICARDPDELRRAETDLLERGARVFSITCDVTDQESVDHAVNMIRDVYGEIDILVNNAGLIQVGPLQEMTLDDFEAALKTHFWAPLYTTLAVVPGMRRQRLGRIVNISSLAGRVAAPHLVPYSASKFALTGLSQALRAELAKDGILVTTVLPGLMRTGSPVNAIFKGHNCAEYALFSIADSLPGLSVSAELAARQIVNACRYGDPELVISWPAKLAALFHAVFPGVTADALAAVDRLLPGPGGVGSRSVKGRDSTSALSPSWATWLSDQAALANNETIENGYHPHAS